MSDNHPDRCDPCKFLVKWICCIDCKLLNPKVCGDVCDLPFNKPHLFPGTCLAEWALERSPIKIEVEK